MPGTRTTRKYTRKMRNPAAAPDAGESNMSFENSAPPDFKRRLDTRLYDYLTDYDARLINIERKYPLGDRERPGMIEAHKKNGVKRIMEICGVKA